MKKTYKRIIYSLILVVFLFNSNLYSQNESVQIDSLIVNKRAFNEVTKNTVVYKIQLYNGNETDAYNTKKLFEKMFSEYDVKIIYKSPEWKTQVGDFKTRLEADRVLLTIQQKFAGAIVLQDKI